MFMCLYSYEFIVSMIFFSNIGFAFLVLCMLFFNES